MVDDEMWRGYMPVIDTEYRKSVNNKSRAAAIATVYGYDPQSRQCIEEMAELTQAINKFWRKQLCCGKTEFDVAMKDSKEYENIVEELADVQIMIWQMISLMECEEDVQANADKKLQRQYERATEELLQNISLEEWGEF